MKFTLTRGYLAVLIILSLVFLVRTNIDSTESAGLGQVGNPLPPELKDEPDVFMEHATITQYSQTGHPKYELYSKLLRHFEGQHLTRLSSPKMTIYPQDKDENTTQSTPNSDQSLISQAPGEAKIFPWVIESIHGYLRLRPDLHKKLSRKIPTNLNAGGLSIHPSGNAVPSSPQEVIFLRKNVKLYRRSAQGQDLQLRTSKLYVYPQQQYAETDQPVMIDSKVGRTKAAGFSSNLKTGLLNLHSSKKQRVHTIVLPRKNKPHPK
ncbi:MAG: LPS export ABC transporter periplasmic protein LptC [Pseudomonadales bacterium]|nr:LPS export ABC transporter periplasmic protein LptC [Pseudomonadales bacterium]